MARYQSEATMAKELISCAVALIASQLIGDKLITDDTTFNHPVARHRMLGRASPASLVLIENDIDILNYCLKLRVVVIDRLIYPKLLQQVLVRGRCGSDNFGATRLGDLHSERPDPAGTAVNQNRLSGAQSSLLH